ncbi:MAG: twin-arginine translocase subunit TatC [Euryarchaeota archaeon]|nr:twin-arginine translocase subunit TatC [Euryarchaeota archaeon]MBU4221131.1 twin-arginine translocase subunit TatC [Euryarchaeota archaeon]MBU4454422.1 twin-arginine translocase subunit TatC [Euryarchaeota archaeon]
MAMEEVAGIVAELRKKLIYIVALFGFGTIVSFSFMGELIKRIEYDMFWRISLSDKPDAAGQLVNISNNLSFISEKLAANSSVIAQNLTLMSGELLNISRNLNLQTPAIVYLSPMEVLMLEFKLSLICGVIITLPLVIYYIYKGIRRKLLQVLPVSVGMLLFIFLAALILFLLGAGYSYYFLLPVFLTYIYQDAASMGVNATFSVYEFIYFIVITTVIFGISFDLPLLLIMMSRLGIATRQTLAHYRRHAYVIMLIIAAWVTPDPTMLSQIMLMVPFVILYEISLLVMRVTGK